MTTQKYSKYDGEALSSLLSPISVDDNESQKTHVVARVKGGQWTETSQSEVLVGMDLGAKEEAVCKKDDRERARREEKNDDETALTSGGREVNGTSG